MKNDQSLRFVASCRCFAALLAPLALFAIASESHAQTFSWKANVNSVWSTAGNWSTGAVPGSASTAVINDGGTARVDGSFTVGSLTVGGVANGRTSTLLLNSGGPGVLTVNNSKIDIGVNGGIGVMTIQQDVGPSTPTPQLNVPEINLGNGGTLNYSYTQTRPFRFILTNRITGSGAQVNFFKDISLEANNTYTAPTTVGPSAVLFLRNGGLLGGGNYGGNITMGSGSAYAVLNLQNKSPQILRGAISGVARVTIFENVTLDPTNASGNTYNNSAGAGTQVLDFSAVLTMKGRGGVSVVGPGRLEVDNRARIVSATNDPLGLDINATSPNGISLTRFSTWDGGGFSNAFTSLSLSSSSISNGIWHKNRPGGVTASGIASIGGTYILRGSNASSPFNTFSVASGGTLTMAANMINDRGDSGFIKHDVGNLILTGSNSYTGPVVILAGTLSVGNGGTTGNLGAGTISNNGTLLLNRSDSLTVGNTIVGTGSLTKSGAGTATITANNTYSGATAVNAGLLLVNGRHTGGQTYTVSGPAILGGTGTLSAGVVVNSGGAVAPGPVGAVGEFTVGSLSLNSGGTLRSLLDGGSASFLNVTGAVNLNGGINFSTNSAPTTQLYPLLKAGTSLSGVFSSINNLPSGYEIFYGDANTVFLKRLAGPAFSVTPLLSSGDSLITGGTLPFAVSVVNSGTTPLSFTAASGANTTGSVPSTTVNGGDSTNAAGISFNGTTVGANQTGTFTATSGATTTNVSVSGISVYAHAAGSVVGGTTLGFAPVHVGYTAGGASTNSITVSNAATNVSASLRANLGVTNNNTSLVSVLRGVSPGTTAALTGNLAASRPVGQFSTNVTLTFFDDSTLSGATSNLGTTNITVTGYVYSGQGVWTAGSGGSWASISNWQVPGGIPGVDGALSLGDTATFGALGNGPVTLNTDAGLLSITFSNTTPYTISGSGGITLAAFGGTNAAITTLAGAHTVSNAVTAGSLLNLSNATGSSLNLAGAIIGTNGLSKTGAGTTTLLGASTYSGPTIIAAGGTLGISAAGVIGGGNYGGAITNDGVFVYDSSAMQRLVGTISGSGSLVKNGGSTLTINPTNASGANTFTGGTTVNGGTLVISGNDKGNSVLGPGTVTVNAGATLLNGSLNPLGWDNSAVTPDVLINGGTWNGGDYWAGFRNLTLSNGTLQRTSQFWYKNQPGVITVLGNSFITGGSYSLRQSNSTSLPFNDFNVASNSILTVSAAMVNGGFNSSEAASGFIKTGAGTMVLTSVGNTYVGNTIISNGTLAVTGKLANNAGNTVTVNSNASFVFANNDVFGVHSATVIAPIVINGGTVRNSGSFFNALGPITMNGGTLAALDTIFGLSFSLKGLVTVNSNSTISGPGISLGAAAVTGTTFNVANGANLTVDSGLLNGWSVNINPPNPSFLTKTGTGTMQLNGTNTYTGTTTISAGTLSLGGAGVLGGGNYSGSILNSGTLVVGTTANQILGGVISGSGALVKDAVGTLTLDGVNTYTGTTTINEGTFLLNGEHTGGAGYSVNNGGTLGGLGSTTSLVNVVAGGNITPGAGSTEELIIGGLTLDGRLNVFLDGESTSLLSVMGSATLSGTSSVSFSQGPNAITAPIYVFLAATNGISGTFSVTNNVPAGYAVFYDTDGSRDIAFLKNNAANFVATAIFEGENAVIGSATTNFSVYAFNGSSSNAAFTANNGLFTTGGPLSTNITASNGVELSSLTFTSPGTNFGINTGTFTADFNGQTDTVEYEVTVYDNARGSLVTSGTNPVTVSLGSAIVGYTNPLGGNVTVSNAPGFRVALGAAGSSTISNLTFTDARDIEAGTTGNLLFALAGRTNIGQFTNTVDVRFFDDSTLNGASTNLGTTNFTVTGAIYNHALAVTNGTNLSFRPVHQNAGGLLIATNSINISNQSGFRVALGSANTYTNEGLSVGSVQDLAAGTKMNIGAAYNLGLVPVVGQFTNFVQVRFFDDSTLDGASTNVGTATIAVSGYVYTGKGIWTGNGTNWAAITNWLAPGGTPGLDGAFSVNDTATFDTNGTSYTVDLAEDASLRAITFSNTANAYTIGGSGEISLTAASEGSATLANLAGSHTVSSSIRMGSALQVTNASGTQLTLAGVLTGFNGLTKSGPGTLTLGGANTYSGTTTVTGGTLQATTNGAFSSQSGVVLNGGTIDIGATTQVLPSLNMVTGTHNQTNGTLSVVTASSSDSLLLASQADETVVYNLSGGTLSTTNSNLQVGWLGDATFNQTGGVVDIAGYFVLGRFADSTGTYDLSAGTATQSSAARNMIIGEDGIGSMIVRGSGVLTDKGIIQLGLGSGRGTLTISNGGVVDAPGINLGTRIDNLLVFDIASAQTNFSVPITGAGSVVKAGTGTVVFDQNNSYGGTTTISNGTLVVNGIHANAGTYTVMSNAVLAGTGEINGFVSVQNGGTINPGVGGNNEEFKIGGLEIQSGGILNVVLGGATTSQLQVAGGVTLDATSVLNFSTNAPLTAALYPFLTYGGATSGTFGVTNNLPAGYEVIYDTDDKLVALLFSATNYAVAPVFNGENAVITGGTLPFNVFVYNNTATDVAVTATGGTSTTGSASTNVPSETSDSLAGLTWTGAAPGLNQTGNITAVFTPPAAGPVQTNTVNVVVSVYDHASNVITGNSLGFAAVHARNTNPVATTNSITVSNSALGGPRVALGVTNINTNSAVVIDDVAGLVQGDSIEINGLLDPGSMGLGRFTNTVQLVSFDDSNLNGAITLGTNAITVTGYIYSGQGEWNTPGGGNWANIAQWQVPGGTPGLDGAFSIEDTALFGTNGSGTVTNNGNVQMLSMTFSNGASSYTIGGTGSITLAAAGTSDAAITTLDGAHTVDNRLELGSNVILSNAADTALTLNKPVDGPFGLIKEGSGTTTLNAANTYTGGTTVNGGLLNVNAAKGLENVSNNVLTINAGIVSLNTSDVFVQHNQAINAPVVINAGGTLQNAEGVYNPLGPVYLNGGTILSISNQTAGYSFSFKGDVIVDGNATSTISGPGMALGAAEVDFTRFEVADGSTLEVTGTLVDGPRGPSGSDYPFPQPSRLEKEGEGRMVLSGTNSYSGGTRIDGGTLAVANVSALGKGPVELVAGTLELRSPLQIASLVWDGGGGATQIAISNPGTNFLTVDTPISLLNGVNNFNLAGAAPTGPVKLLAAPDLANNDISLFGFEGLDPDAYRLEYGEDGALYLVLIPQPAPVPVPVPVPEPEKPKYPDFTQFAGNPNQMQVAKALNQWVASGPSGDRAAVLDALVASADYQKAFDAMMPSQYASLPNMAFNQANALNSGMFQRLWVIRINGKGFSSTLSPAPMQAEMGGVDDMDAFAINPSRETKWGTFVDGNGIFADGGDVANLQNYRSQSGGVSAGASYKWTDTLATGVYVGYQGLQAQYDNGQTIDNAVRFGVFGTYEIGGVYFNALAGGAYHDYSVEREIEFGSIDRTARGRPGAGEFDLAIGTGYDFKAGDFTFGPFTTMQYTYLGVQGFKETGADSLNLDVDPYNSSSLLYTLGAQIGYNWKVSPSVLVTPTLFAGWQHEFLQNGYQINSSFATGGPASPFSYNTGTPARDNFYGGVGVTVGIGERWQATAIYSSFVGGNSQNSQNVYLGLGLNF